MRRTVRARYWRMITKTVVAGLAAVGIVRLAHVGPLWTQDPFMIIGIIVVAVVLVAD